MAADIQIGDELQRSKDGGRTWKRVSIIRNKDEALMAWAHVGGVTCESLVYGACGIYRVVRPSEDRRVVFPIEGGKMPLYEPNTGEEGAFQKGSTMEQDAVREWRKRQIVMDRDLAEHVSQWHGGQFTSTYALASTAMENLVSLSMIDAAITELEATAYQQQSKDKPSPYWARHRKDRDDLAGLIGDLHVLRSYWKESTAREYGMDIGEDEYEYDEAEYDLTPEEELEHAQSSIS